MRPRGYARPRVRQVRAADGRRCWVYHLRCRCGWSQHVAGHRAALAAGDAHWMAAHWRRPA